MSEPLPAHTTDAPESGTPTDPYAGRPVRWGFVGAGHIARALADAIRRLDGNELVAVAARDQGRAQAFADEFGAARAYGDYAQVCADPEVDVVYVNTTHPFHHEQALMAIAGGKHLLVEKAFTLNAGQAQEVAAAAQAKGLFVMEAMWMRTQPLVREIERLVAAGEIGDLVKVGVDFAVPFPYDENHRLFDLDNGGGALLDLGVYATTFAYLFLGRPETVQVMGSLAPTGADQVVAMQWGYDNGATAQIFCTSQGCGQNRAVIVGRRGWIAVEPPFHSSTRARVHTGDLKDFEERDIEVMSRRYEHEVEEVERCLRSGLTRSPIVDLDDTIAIMEIMDAARSELGVRYPQE